MMSQFKNPIPTVDIIIEIKDNDEKKIVLIERVNPPFGWAIPGGFVDYGEALEDAAMREAFEETGLKVKLTRQFHTYSDPSRDKRKHTITTVYIARSEGRPVAGDDAKNAKLFRLKDIPDNMVFDHRQILDDYINKKY